MARSVLRVERGPQGSEFLVSSFWFKILLSHRKPETQKLEPETTLITRRSPPPQHSRCSFLPLCFKILPPICPWSDRTQTVLEMQVQMQRLRILLIVCIIHLATGFSALAQTADPQSRESEWKRYKLPAAEFSRFVAPTRIVSFRAPAGWERSGLLQFKGPHESNLQVLLEKVPDGIPLKSFTNAVLQNLRNIPGGADSLTVRPTEISGQEAREFFFTLPDLRGETTRRMIWCTVSGPNAISFAFICPESKAAELEPYFKAVIESIVIFESDAECDLFERLRSAAIKEEKPVKIDHVRSLVETITGFNDAARRKAVEALATVFDTNPDAAVELLMDRDSIVRGSAVEAVGRSSNRGLDGFLVRALADQSATVAVRAARSLAKRDDIVKLLREDSAGWEGLQINR